MAGTDQRLGRAARAARPRWSTVLSVVAISVLAVACRDSSAGGNAERGAADPDGAVSTEQACAPVQRYPCSAVIVGGRAHRYSVFRSPEAASGGLGHAVVVDLGGPGRSLFGSPESLDFANAWAGDETLVFFEEPWVAEQTSSQCAAALSDFYVSLHDATDTTSVRTASDDVAAACDLGDDGRWGWSHDAYRAVVDAALAAEDLDLVGVVGSSFGASRSAHLWNEPGVKWAILNSPSPLTATGSEYLAARAEGALDALAAGCPTCSAGNAGPVVERAVSELDEAPVELDTRTPLVNGMDVSAAVVALPYLSGADLAAEVAALSAGATKARNIGLLSDSVLMRYGTTDMAPGMLAYYQEVCRDLHGWTIERTGEPVHDFLADLHGPCSGVPAEELSFSSAPAATCLATAVDDRVTPEAFARQWAEILTGPMEVVLPGSVHASAEGARACYAAITQNGSADGPG